MTEDLCTALCQLDNSLDASLFLTVGGVALTLAVFLYTTVAQIEDRHTNLSDDYAIKPAARHRLAQLKLGLRKILYAWWLSVLGVVYSLSFDLSTAVPLVKPSDVAAHLDLLAQFRQAALPVEIDTLSSTALLAVVLGMLSYGAWLIFPDMRDVLADKEA
ncbi:hypothetical protein G3580_12650 [Nitrogeniibacter mangrovi]|uniref:Uncharacterized protein n=1 Tax=Nitrogeniibacter mangrovi TaxID=2016596 RepID=A0A6C1B6R3_9RHOO|nr:hypothetical protein [Nitrogeniibacter mangrovi]QID18408.1 hypothetical protein G3580_12650 [Nitrogeniibacter mangrovi]